MTSRIALVTGASRGLGRGIARGLASRGATVYLTARSEDALGEVVD
ncbi:MAG: SDR family NAD(P)-dependent oxidoreductase, partial [Rhizobiaceae bacterium]